MTPPAARTLARTRGLAGNVVLLALAMLVTLAVVEGALAALRPRAQIGRFAPGAQTFFHHEFTEHRTANRFGFRESGFSPTRSTHNVLLLGDSFVEGTGQSDRETIAWILNEHFDDKRYQFFNAGVSGTNVAEYRETYRRVTQGVKVDFSSVVVVVFLGNDFLSYERLPSMNDGTGGEEPREGGRLSHRVLGRVVPNTLALLRQARNALRPESRVAMARSYTARTHIDWFDENAEYFGRGPMTPEEGARLEARFDRIPERSKELIGEGMLNLWTYHAYVTEPLNDFIYNLDSERNETAFLSTMNQLGTLLDSIGENASVVLIPDKIQVSESERAVARAIVASPDFEDELENVLKLNERMLAWLVERHPRVRVYDATEELLARGAEDYYYVMDGHMRPAGAELVAEGMLSLFR